jgi:hypothetical protein
MAQLTTSIRVVSEVMNRGVIWSLVVLTAGVLTLGGCGGSSTKSTQSSTRPQSASSARTPQPAVPAVSSSPSGLATVSASAGGVTASMHAGSHHPKVGRPWPIRFMATRGGHAVKASVSYEYLFAGQVVARRSHYTFTGRFSDIFIWPSSAVGYPLTFRAVIVSGATTINLDYPVQVTT